MKMNWLIGVSSVILLFGICNCCTHTYGSQFFGHELLHKEVILNASSVAPQNYTTVFNYEDKDLQIVTFAKFQIDGGNSTASIAYTNKTMAVTINAYLTTNVTATASIYGYNAEHINSHFIRRLYETKKQRSEPLSFVLSFEYLKIEDDIL